MCIRKSEWKDSNGKFLLVSSLPDLSFALTSCFPAFPAHHGMPRTARAAVGGNGYPVLYRGNGRLTVCHDEDDDAS